jgi:ribosomal protein L7/L12
VEENDPSQLPDEQIEAIRDALFRGNKIQAIKHYREATSLGLAESKAFIDALELRLKQQEPEQFAAAAKKVGCIGVIGTVGATTALARWWL